MFSTTSITPELPVFAYNMLVRQGHNSDDKIRQLISQYSDDEIVQQTLSAFNYYPANQVGRELKIRAALTEIRLAYPIVK